MDAKELVQKAENVIVCAHINPDRDVRFRSMDETDCTAVAMKFGGGGHKKAAGCTVNAPLAEAERQVLAEVARLVGSREAVGVS